MYKLNTLIFNTHDLKGFPVSQVRNSHAFKDPQGKWPSLLSGRSRNYIICSKE